MEGLGSSAALYKQVTGGVLRKPAAIRLNLVFSEISGNLGMEIIENIAYVSTKTMRATPRRLNFATDKPPSAGAGGKKRSIF